MKLNPLSVAVASILVGLALSIQTVDFGTLLENPGNGIDTTDILPRAVYVQSPKNGTLYGSIGNQTMSDLDAVFKRCTAPDNACFQSAVKVVREAHLQFDPIGTRQLVTAGAVGYALLTAAGIAIAAAASALVSFAAGIANDGNHIWTEEVAESLADLKPLESAVLSANGEAQATVVIPADPTATTSTGPSAPVVETYATPTGDYQINDTMVDLGDDALAKLLQGDSRKSLDCEDGAIFDDNHPKQRDLESGEIDGRAICSTMFLLENAARGQTLGELAETDFGGRVYEVAQSTGNLADAAARIDEFVSTYYESMGLQEAVAHSLGLILLILVAKSLIENIPIGRVTRVAASDLKYGGGGGGGDTACPKPTDTICAPGWDCNPAFENKKYVCADGVHKGCSCFPLTPVQGDSDPGVLELYQAIMNTPSVPTTPTTSYNQTSYKHILTGPDDWNCTYEASDTAVNGFCRCNPIADGCDECDISATLQTATTYGCADSPKDDLCASCRPWQVACDVHVCKKSSRSQCGMCDEIDT